MKSAQIRLSFTLTAAIFLLLLTLSACGPGLAEIGVLEGQVSIGPLSPVLQDGETPPTPAPEVYATRKIVVFEADGETEVARIEIGPDGRYHAELPAGEYLVDINHAGIDFAKGLPATVTIEPGGTVTLDIDIDTEIR